VPDLARCAARPSGRDRAGRAGYPSAAERQPWFAGERETEEPHMNVRALAAEAIGTFILVGMGSMGVASAVIIGQSAGLFAVMLIVPFAFGLGLLAAIAIAGETSGGHFNPAVTLAAVIDRRLDWMSGIGYAIAQAVGAFAASLFIQLTLSAQFVKATVNQPIDIGAGSPDQYIRAFSVEIVLTAIFVAVILTVATRRPNAALFVIPLTLIAIHFVGIPVSGASVNPIRSLAPAVVSGTYDGLWAYIAGPFLGAILGWGLFRFFNPADEDLAGEDEDEDDLDEFEDDEELEPA
jgi:MIP family channel proteins